MNRSIGLISGSLALCQAGAAYAAVTLEGVAMTGVGGLIGPGVEANTTFLDLNPPAVDSFGNAVFFAFVEGPNVPSGGDRGAWRHTAGANSVAIREGTLSPFNGAPISFLLNDPHGGSDNVVARTFDETLAVELGFLGTLAHFSMAAPDVGPGVTFGSLDAPRVDANDNYSFICFLDGAVTSTDAPAVYSGGLGSLSLIARGDGAAPDTSGDTFSGFSDLSMSPDGGIGLLGNLTSGGAGIWSGTPGSLSLVAKLGDSLPGLGTLVSLISFSVGDSSGSVAFKGFTSAPSIANEGLWAGTAGALQLAYAEGGQVDGLPVGVQYGSQSADPAVLINSAGQIGAVTRLKGTGVDSTNWQAIVVGTPGSMSAVVRTGDVAPDSGGMTLQNITGFAMGESGHIAFIALITDGIQSDVGMYAWHDSTGLMLVAREGDVVSFGAGGNQTIENITFVNNITNGRPSGLGHDGTLGFGINFNGFERGVVLAALPGGGTNPSDFNSDGVVDGADLAALLAAWGPCPAPCPQDLTGDGTVSGADLAILLAAWTP